MPHCHAYHTHLKICQKNINELSTLYVIHSNLQLHHIDFTRGERVIQDLKLLQTFKEF